jgi:hypothetical protein
VAVALVILVEALVLAVLVRVDTVHRLLENLQAVAVLLNHKLA